MEWQLKTFPELTNEELYKIIQLRIDVFVVEQQCVFQDLDNKDILSKHLCAWDRGTLAAYCRIVPPGISYPEMSIGRIVNHKDYRGAGVGRKLVQQAIEAAYLSYGKFPIRIGAQYYLKRFYESFGFIQQSEIYLEDGIEHIHMILS